MTRWGVVGPGAIAAGFADAMRMVDGGRIVAVASRSAERADSFADRFGIPGPLRRLRRAGRGSRGRGGVRGHAAVAPHRRHPRPPAGGQARALREAVRPRRRAGAPDGRGGAEPGLVPHGGDLEPLPPRLPVLGRGGRVRSDRRAAARGGRLRVPPAVGSRSPPVPPGPRRRRPARSGHLPPPALHAAPRAGRACRGGGHHRGDGGRRARGGGVAACRRWARSDEVRAAREHDLHRPGVWDRAASSRFRP